VRMLTGGQVADFHSHLFSNIVDIALDSAGKVYVAQNTNNLIYLINAGTVSNFCGGGTPWFGLLVDSQNTLYGTRSGSIYKFSGAKYTRVAGPQYGTGFVDGPAASAEFCKPVGLVHHPTTGVIYIADQCNSRVRALSKGVVTTVLGGGPTQNPIGCVGGPADRVTVSQPRDLALDAKANKLYIAGCNGVMVLEL